ncbi:hypothetical protein GCM10023085_46080 [Actinomadura viridis]|uniref:Chromosome segregation ATPase n=1 Tax=Actinomadura viridis TaxID=58110 RepID=A0A931DJY8_9ACTN|nr:hypothetical protein [Actinomadura viridis]MBG6089968.1 chromosome segregation ATPase [Actinomadura viridis]
MAEISLPPSSRYLGSLLTVTRPDGRTVTGVLAVVGEDGITLQQAMGAEDRVPHAEIVSARTIETEPPATGGMSDERLAKIREHVALLDNIYGCFDDLHRTFARDVTELLAEVKRLRDLRVKDMHWEAHLGEALWNGQGSIAELAEQVTKLRAEMAEVRTQRDEAQAALDRLRAAALEASEDLRAANGRIAVQEDQIGLLTLKLTRAERERDEARAQRGAVAKAADADDARHAAAEEDADKQIRALVARAQKAEAQRDEAWTTITELRAQTVALGKDLEDRGKTIVEYQLALGRMQNEALTAKAARDRLQAELDRADEQPRALEDGKDSDECTGCGTETTDLYVDPSPRPSEAQAQYCRDCADGKFDLGAVDGGEVPR